ncbi:hypothetical protein [Rhodovulum sp. FJ3]|uniref:hypothetical protein n=1 Tax=Rhodovulum sp. FJ3 TaxID=3079053 RepID=UPI00293DBA37|nr:hypothetical protein [Rhodovulum sp. FJ3]MDV4168239.1 hypothetical protein [Rhodovulum sp. FJ3]
MTKPFLLAGVMTATFATGAVAQDCTASGDAEVGIVEIVQFRLADGVDRDQFIAAAASTMPILCTMNGFIGRVLSEGEDESWTDHVRWTDTEAAQAAMAASMENEALLPFMMSVDPETMTLTYQVPIVLE